MIRIASAQYSPSYLNNWDDYVCKITSWVTNVADEKADLLLFPEYASLELLSLFPNILSAPYHTQFTQLNTLLQQYLDLYATLAKKHSMTIIPGTFPIQEVTNNSIIFKNRAFVISPDGIIGSQDKLMMTRFESEDWIITAGSDYSVINTDFGKLGIAICYDSEFSALVNKLIDLGAEIILVPSCTDSIAGYNRVKIACQARALENQCLVVQSALIGDAPWCDAIDTNYGAAGFFTPPDRNLPSDGILRLGQPQQSGWVITDIDTTQIAASRIDGQTLNYKDAKRLICDVLHPRDTQQL